MKSGNNVSELPPSKARRDAALERATRTDLKGPRRKPSGPLALSINNYDNSIIELLFFKKSENNYKNHLHFLKTLFKVNMSFGGRNDVGM